MSTYSFNPNDLSAYGLDWVRFQIQDTDPQYWLLADQEIQMCIDSERDHWGAAAQACEVISRGFLRRQDVKLGRSLQIMYAKASQQYMAMAQTLRRKSMGTVVPFVGGMSVSAKWTYTQDSDILAALFTKTMLGNPWTGGYTSDSLAPVGNATDDAGYEFV